MGYQYLNSDVELALWQKNETLMKSFAFALYLIHCSAESQSVFKIRTLTRRQRLSLLLTAHTSAQGTHAQVYAVFVLICSPAETQEGGWCTPLALTGLFIFCLYTEMQI